MVLKGEGFQDNIMQNLLQLCAQKSEDRENLKLRKAMRDEANIKTSSTHNEVEDSVKTTTKKKQEHI